MRTKKEKGKPSLTAGIGSAVRFGFYLLQERIDGEVRWAIYDRATGASVGLYWPDTGKWMTVGRLGEERGEDRRLDSLFARFRKLADAAGV